MLSRFKSKYLAGSPPEPVSKEEARPALREAVASDITPELDSYVTDNCLDRYLRARNYDVEKARRMLQAALSWRVKYRPDTLVDRHLDLLKSESETGKMYVLPTADINQRATIVMRPGLENSTDSTGKIANLVYTLERASKIAEQAGGEQYVVVVDYNVGVISTSTLPSLSVSRETTNILQGYYPERLSCMVLVNAPRIFLTMYTVIKPLIDVKTREKLHFVRSPEQVASLDGTDPDALPKDYGGNMDWTFDVTKYFENVVNSTVTGKDETSSSNT